MFILQAYWQTNSEYGWFDYVPYGKHDYVKACSDFKALKQNGSQDRYRLIQILDDTEIHA